MEQITLRAKEAFRSNLKAVLESRGLTYEKLGLMAGVSKQQISNLLNGKNNLTLNETFSQIADALKIEETDLFDPKFKDNVSNLKD